MEKSQNKIKICHLSSVDLTVKFILMNQLHFLQNEGYEISVVCSTGRWIKDIEKEGIKVKTIQFKRKIFSPISDLISFFKLLFYFRKEKFQIVHTHTLKPEFYGQIAAKLAGVPIIIHTNHGFYFHENSSWLRKKFFLFLEKTSGRCSDLIFSINKEDIETAINQKICTPEKIKYSGDGVDTNRFNPQRFSPDFIAQKKKELGIGGKNIVIGIVSRLVKEKGYVDLFKAFKNVVKTFPEAVLLVIGQEEKEKNDFFDLNFFARKHDLEKNVIFLDERTDVDELYSLMDIFVLPSHREGLGLVILEASAMEIPVVTTDIRGCREAVDNGKTGILVPVKNPEKLSEAIIYLIENPKIAKEMGERGRIRVVEEFNERLVFDRIKKEYQNLIKEKLKI